jgi:hypothetical protein
MNRAQRAYARIVDIAERAAREGYFPGSDVSMFRALRELHSVLGQPEGVEYDPDRLVRGLLFNGLAAMPTWTAGPESQPCHLCGGTGRV